jgi:hypothetical protein
VILIFPARHIELTFILENRHWYLPANLGNEQPFTGGYRHCCRSRSP